MGAPLRQGIDIFAAALVQKFSVTFRDIKGNLVYEVKDVEAVDKAHATKLAIRQYRDTGHKDDPWTVIEVFKGTQSGGVHVLRAE